MGNVLSFFNFVLENQNQELLQKYDFLRKEPKYLFLFDRLNKEEGISISKLKEIYYDIQKHRNTLRSFNVDLTKKQSYEEVIDTLSQMELYEKTNKFLKKIPNPLRNNLKNNSEYFKEISNLISDFPLENYTKGFLSKISRLKNKQPEEFLDNLKNYNTLNISDSNLISKVKNTPGAEIIHHEKDQFLVVIIYTKEASCQLGSSQWCISNQNQNMLNYYISGGDDFDSDRYPGIQYFIWNFSLSPNDREYLIGSTVYRDSINRIVSFDKNDNRMEISNEAPYYEFLKDFDELSKDRKLKIIKQLPKREREENVLQNFDKQTVFEILKETPKLIPHTPSLDMFSEEEVLELSDYNLDILSSKKVSSVLSEETKKDLAIEYPFLLSAPYYAYLQEEISKEEKKKISIRDPRFFYRYEKEFSDKEKLNVILENPAILLLRESLFFDLDTFKFKEDYQENTQKWINSFKKWSIEPSWKTASTKILNLLNKSPQRLEEIKNSKLCIFLLEKETENIEKNKIYVCDNILVVDERKINNFRVNSDLIGGLQIYYSLIDDKLINEDDLKGGFYFLKSPPQELKNNRGDEKETEIYKEIIKNKKILNFR
jgi:hypothetical protein